ncbi:MAG: hypothetical protein JWP92_1791 [Caulobacter sp.]|nr:hypothetical protein [Caulobacter sp.]
MRNLVLGLIAAASLGGAASAAPSEGAWLTLKTATTADHLAQDGALWRCKAETCTSSKVKALPSSRACRKVAGQLGAVATFTYRGEALDEAALADCNAAAKPS